MGLFETFLGFAFIPACLIILMLLSTNKMRRQINWVVTHFVNFHFVFNGFKVKVLPLLCAINAIYLFILLKDISRLTHEHDHSKENERMGEHALFIDKLYRDYRSAMMNACSILLILQVYVTARAYENYKPAKDIADKMKKEFN